MGRVTVICWWKFWQLYKPLSLEHGLGAQKNSESGPEEANQWRGKEREVRDTLRISHVAQELFAYRAPYRSLGTWTCFLSSPDVCNMSWLRVYWNISLSSHSLSTILNVSFSFYKAHLNRPFKTALAQGPLLPFPCLSWLPQVSLLTNRFRKSKPGKGWAKSEFI